MARSISGVKCEHPPPSPDFVSFVTCGAILACRDKSMCVNCSCPTLPPSNPPAFHPLRFQGDYVIRVHAWAKNLQSKPKWIVVGDGFGGQPSIPLVNFTNTWRLKGDGPRLLMTVFVNNAKTTLVPGSQITYQQLFQNVNGGGGRYNVQLVEEASDQPTMRAQIYKGFPWSLSPLNIP